MKKFLTLLWMFILAIPMVNGITVTIGNGTATTRYPLNDLYIFSRSQSLYLISEIGMDGTITNIRWYRNDVGPDPNAIGYTEIWLKEKEGDVLSGTAWETPGILVAAIQNIDLGPGGGWYDIPIQPFNYSGLANLLVSVQTYDAPYVVPHASWRYTSTSPNYRVRQGNSDTQNPPAMALSYNRPNIQFEIQTAAPNLLVSPASLDLGYGEAGGYSSEKTYMITGYNLTGEPIQINAPPGFEVSFTSHIGFSPSLVLNYPPPNLPATTIFVRLAPPVPNTDYFGDILNIGGGAPPAMVTVTGNSWEHNKWCTSTATSILDTEIFNVTVGTINNTSDCITPAPGPGSVLKQYSNFFYNIDPAGLLQGTTMDFSVQVGTCGGSYNNALKIFIDFNNDGDFEDADEEAYVSPSYTAGPHFETGVIAIPADAALGFTMMRVVCVETTDPASIMACGTYNWGETEDYRLIISSGTQEMPLYTIPDLYANPSIIEGSVVITGGYFTDTTSNVLCAFYGDWMEDQKMDPQTYIVLVGALPLPIPNFWDGGYILVKGTVSFVPIPYIDPDHPEDTVLIHLAVDSVLILKATPEGKQGGYYEKDGDVQYDLPKACDPCKFAILISGGVDEKNNHAKYWENLVALYKFKVEKQGYCPENVMVNYYQGTRRDNRIPAANVKKADKATITTTFTDIKNKVAACTNSGNAATFQKMVTNHGASDGSINLLGAEKLTPTELKNLEQQIIDACCTTMYDEFLQCYGGYVVDELANLDNKNKTTIYVNSNADKKTGISTDKQVHSYLAAKIAALTSGLSYPQAVVAGKIGYDNFLNNKANEAQQEANAWAASSPGYFTIDGVRTYMDQAAINQQVQAWLAWKAKLLDRICESKNNIVTPMKAYCEWKEYVVPPGGQLVLDFSGDPANCGNVTVYKGNKNNKVGSWNWNIPGSRRFEEGNSRRVINGDENSTTTFWVHNDNGAFRLTSSSNGNHNLDESGFNAIQYPGWSFGGTDSSAAEFTPMVSPVYFYPNIDYTPMSTLELPAYLGQAFVQNFTFTFNINTMDEYWTNMELYLRVSEVMEPGELMIFSENSPEPMHIISITEPGIYTVPLGNMTMAGEYGVMQMMVSQAKTNLAIALDCWGLHSVYDPDLADHDFGDAPEGVLAYPATGVIGQFPTCIQVGPATWVNHFNFGAGFGPAVDFENDGNAGLCPVFSPTSYDADECFSDGDAGLIKPSAFTIQNNQVVSCPNSGTQSLANICSVVMWGQNIDIHVVNNMPNQAPGYVNVLMDWNQDGTWAGSSNCSGSNVPEHVLVDFPVPNGFNGPLSALNPPSFSSGPNQGYVWTRFTITDTPLNTSDWHGDGQYEDGESEDYLLLITNNSLDMGDAPLPYPTLLANNGARHAASTLICSMGSKDYEADGQPDVNALGDDNNQLDDEDGVTFNTLLYPGQTASMTVQYTGGTTNYLQVWIDYNADGDWADSGEKIFTNRTLTNGNNTLVFTIPANATVGTTYMRFRISNTMGLNYTGLANNGEVEDYKVNIESPSQTDWGDAPDPTYPTLAASNGARHGNNPSGYYLGSVVDYEPNGIPNATASGDDANNLDDEDGLTFTNPAFIGQTYQWGVTTSMASGYVNIWVDFNIDGDWADAGEHVLVDAGGTGSTWNYFITIPQTAAPGNTFIRIRYSTVQGLSYNGPAVSGEVEDYPITLVAYQYDWGDAPYSPPTFNYPTYTAQNGANHFMVPGMYLGNLIDGEADGQFDDNDPFFGYLADEDGVLYNWPNNMVTGFPMNLKVNASTSGKLDTWMDFNADGDWNDGGEQIFTSVTLSAGDNFLSFVVPRNASTAFTSFPYFSRYRFSTAGGLTYTGTASDGEVEDHAVAFSINNLYQWSQPYQQNYTSLSGLHCHDAIVGGQMQVINGADDFICHEGNVSGIIWYGSYEAPGSGIKNFHLSIHTPAANCLPLDPGIWNKDVPVASVNETATGVYNSMGEMIYQYTYIFPTPLLLNPGVSYFVAIYSVSNNSNNPAQWKWQEASRSRVPAVCPAATRTITGGIPGTWSQVYWNIPNTYSEMAFQILSEMDFGDAPSVYPTTLANNGACHSKWWTQLFLGNMIDYESDGKPGVNADGDDLAGVPDEDGVIFMTPLIIGQGFQIQVTVTGTGYLQGWIDFNADGDWSDAGEQIINNMSVTTGVYNLGSIVPPNAITGPTYARFRICTWSLPPNIFNGYLPNGEVEDYAVNLVANTFDWGDAPDPNYPTLKASNGANHFMDGITYLGQLVDTEVDGIPTLNALGDDLSNLADEDGVTVIWSMSPGQPAKIRVEASVGTALFNGWIDFNRNGSWAELNEHVFVDVNLQAGVNYLNFVVPANAQIGPTYARFRFSHQPALSYTGTATDGEVEDYMMDITGSTLKWQQLPDPTLTGFHTHNWQNQVTEIADNWLCSGDPVTTIRWYGNYEVSSGIEKRGSGIHYFRLAIYSNDPQGCAPSPTGELWSWDVLIDDANETSTGLLDPEGGTIYDYYFDLYEPFVQVSGTIYWLGITAMANDSTDPAVWRWQPAGKSLIPVICPAFSRTAIDGVPGQWGALVGAQPGNAYDMAFALISDTSPKPPSNFMLVAGPWVNPEPWHTWINGAAGAVTPIVLHAYDPDNQIIAVNFYYNLDNSGLISFDYDIDGTETPLEGNGTGKEGETDGWCGYFEAPSASQNGTIRFAAEIELAGGGTEWVESFFDIFFDIEIPDVEVNVDDWMQVEEEEFNLQFGAGGHHVDKMVVIVEKKQESFFKGIPLLNQHDPKRAFGGDYHCSPTAAAACLQYFADSTGDTTILGGIPAKRLVDILAKLAGTNRNGTGTFTHNLVNALTQYINLKGNNYTIRQSGFNWKLMRNELERCQDVLVNIKWPNSKGHTNTFNSIINRPNPDGTIRVDFMDPWTGQIEYGNLNPATGVLTGYNPNIGAQGSIESLIIICPKEQGIQPGGGVVVPGPYPPDLPIYFPDTGLYWVRVITINQDGMQGRKELVVHRVLAEKDFGDAPDPAYPTLLANNGPSHKLSNLLMGTLIDPETDGQPHLSALGDDLNNLDDEDGVFFNSNLVPGQVIQVKVIATGPGYLQGWLDINHDGDWNDAGERIFTDKAVVAGDNNLTFTLNPAALVGKTFARFRLSTVQNLGYTGAAPDGEVEDYMVYIVKPQGSKMHWPQRPDAAGWAVEFANSKLGDDFLCTESGPISHVRFWIGWMDNLVNPVGSFTMSICSDIPVQPGGPGYSMPGQTLWSRTFTPGQYDEEFMSEHVQGWYNMPPGTGHDPLDHTKWKQITVKNIANPYNQTKGTIYWLVIQFGANDWVYKGWVESVDPQFNDAAVFFYNNNWLQLLDPDNGERLDLSFIISSAPFLSVNPLAIPAQVCQGTPVQLMANASGGSGSYTYGWTSVPPGFTSNIADPVATPAETTIYTVTVNDGYSTATGSVTVVVHTPPQVFCPPDMSVCVNDPPFQLTGAIPQGGVYSGSGVSNGFFNPSAAGVGVHTITYSYTDQYGCSGTCTFTITVKAIPTVTCPQPMAVCQGDPVILLDQAVPSGGVYSGDAVYLIGPDYYFDPDIAPGTYVITYCYTDPGTGCTGCCEFNMVVKPLPNVTCPDDFNVCYNQPPFNLSGGNPIPGTYTGWGVVNNVFYPAVAGVGSHTITYCYFDPQMNCSNCCTFVITVLQALVNCPEDMTVCISDEAFMLTGATPEGGIYEGAGVLDGMFYPGAAGVGVHTITYTYFDQQTGCTDFCTFLIQVLPSQIISLPQGWGGISTYLEPLDPDIIHMFAPVLENFVIVHNFDAASTYYPAGGQYPSIPWNTYSGYYLRMYQTDQITICGHELQNRTLNLQQGWNLTPVLSNVDVDVESIYGSVNQVLIVLEVAGPRMYWKQFGINTLVSLESGKAYFVYATGACSVVFPEPGPMKEGKANIPVMNTTGWNNVQYTPVTHLFAFESAACKELMPGDVIGFFTQDGTCAGMMNFTGLDPALGVVAFGNDVFSNETTGFAENEKIIFRLWKSGVNETFDLSVAFDEHYTGKDRFISGERSVIKSMDIAVPGVTVPGMENIRIYPNPAHGLFNIEGTHQPASLIIFNAFGHEMIHQPIIIPGKIDLTDKPIGVYYIKVQTEKGLFLDKLIVN